jgi:hypothetical protein
MVIRFLGEFGEPLDEALEFVAHRRSVQASTERLGADEQAMGASTSTSEPCSGVYLTTSEDIRYAQNPMY